MDSRGGWRRRWGNQLPHRPLLRGGLLWVARPLSVERLRFWPLDQAWRYSHLGSQSVAEMRGAPVERDRRHWVTPACSCRQHGPGLDTMSLEITSFTTHRHTASRSCTHTGAWHGDSVKMDNERDEHERRTQQTPGTEATTGAGCTLWSVKQTQSEACLVRACVNSAAQWNELEYFAPCQDTAQSKQRCRTLRATYVTMIPLDADSGPSQKPGRRHAGHGGTAWQAQAMRVSLWWDKGYAPVTVARRHLSDATDGLCQTKLQLGAVGRLRLGRTTHASLLKFGSHLDEPASTKVPCSPTQKSTPQCPPGWKPSSWKEILRARSGCSVLGWTSSPRLAGTVPARCRTTWRSLQGWQRLSPGRSRKPWVRAVWSGIACRLVEQGQPTMWNCWWWLGSFLMHFPRELLRMRQCDLVPPLRGALQNFSIILAAEETGRPTKVRTFNGTLVFDGLLARKFVPFWMALRGPGSKSPLWPFTCPIFCRFFQKGITDLTLPLTVYH